MENDAIKNKCNKKRQIKHKSRQIKAKCSLSFQKIALVHHFLRILSQILLNADTLKKKKKKNSLFIILIDL